MRLARRSRSRDRRQQFRDQRRAVDDPVHQNALVGRVRAFADAAQSIQRRNPQRRRKITVRSAAGKRLLDLHAQFASQFLRHAEQLYDPQPSAPWAADSGRRSLRCEQR